MRQAATGVTTMEKRCPYCGTTEPRPTDTDGVCLDERECDIRAAEHDDAIIVIPIEDLSWDLYSPYA